ncbi:MAG: EAL domain-containing protein [Gammaproteobacteria bacterium]|nr:EAL domain-containing protein [Gammaproteobacteria bacterium]MBU0827617.1 EAL domain-containing protein [Gammaproteobacteria bacterium]MBU0891626.1 EAL domain-containing protein [Gammaproteobacteria bacterium]MBU1816771.1 EAL domain-containing protein [Gammaproteobacteria bacterium]
MRSEKLGGQDSSSATIDAAQSVESYSGLKWRILVVDNDPDVHAATRAALEGKTLFDRPLVSMHAFSGDEARSLLLSEHGLAMVILDVVSEQACSGLELVDFIRHSADLRNTRIVLRTGQPCQVPRLETLLKYDINDYRTKAELTQDRLLAMVVTAVRSYQQLCAVDASRASLELILRSSATLLETKDSHEFASGVLTQLAAMLKVGREGLVCARRSGSPHDYYVQAAAGRFFELEGLPLDLVSSEPELDTLLKSVERRCNVYGDNGGLALHIGHKDEQDIVVFIDAEKNHSELDPQLLGVFCANLSTLLHNRGLLERLHDSAYYDPLVSLPNRAHFVKEVDEYVRHGIGDYVLALIDIDDFSATNDVMGHRFGDRLLERVARCLQDSLTENVLLARLGADTFGVLGSIRQVQPKRLLECVRLPLNIDGVPHKVSLTCGYVLLPEEPQAGADLVKDATIALKRAKRDHRGQDLQYADQMGAEARARALLLSELREAIENKRLFLVYQPQLNLRTHGLVGIEALLRWRTEDGRFVPPDQFIPVAEHSGLIVPLGQWVLSTACQTMRELLDAGIAPERMAVNVSTVQLQDPGFFAMVFEALEGSGLQGIHLELEITESVAALPTEFLNSTLSALRAEGISIAIDDFGTGYSSLSYLERLPLDRIKIDRLFINQLLEPDGARIAEMVAQLGSKLGLRVLAEGIEDAATWEVLLAMDCHEGQGYHIAMPMGRNEMVGWLQTHPKRAQLEAKME